MVKRYDPSAIPTAEIAKHKVKRSGRLAQIQNKSDALNVQETFRPGTVRQPNKFEKQK